MGSILVCRYCALVMAGLANEVRKDMRADCVSSVKHHAQTVSFTVTGTIKYTTGYACDCCAYEHERTRYEVAVAPKMKAPVKVRESRAMTLAKRAANGGK